MSAKEFRIALGVKSDPVEYRYSYEWLFDLLAEEGIRHMQLGTFLEMYHLPDEYFAELRDSAETRGISISSMFTTHREYSGFFRDETGWEAVARRNFERMIEIGAILGCRHVGASPGSVLRDQMQTKEGGIARYLKHMKELMAYAHEKGLAGLTMEPMSCLAEPPVLPEELALMAGSLMDYHRATPGTTPVGLCADVSHGYADENRTVVYDHMALFEAGFPWLLEVHLKNTDRHFDSTFGFGEADRARGVVDLEAVRELILTNADIIPVKELVCYFETGGPKLGRDYSDHLLGGQLRESLRYIRSVFRETPVDSVPAEG